jgi:hypothetical protein
MLYIVVTNFGKILEFLSFLGHFYQKQFVIEHSFFKMQKICQEKNNHYYQPFLMTKKKKFVKKATEIEMIFGTKFSKKSPDRNIRHIFVKQHKSPMTSSHYIFLESTPFSSFLDCKALVDFFLCILGMLPASIFPP